MPAIYYMVIMLISSALMLSGCQFAQDMSRWDTVETTSSDVLSIDEVEKRLGVYGKTFGQSSDDLETRPVSANSSVSVNRSHQDCYVVYSYTLDPMDDDVVVLDSLYDYEEIALQDDRISRDRFYEEYFEDHVVVLITRTSYDRDYGLIGGKTDGEGNMVITISSKAADGCEKCTWYLFAGISRKTYEKNPNIIIREEAVTSSQTK